MKFLEPIIGKVGLDGRDIVPGLHGIAKQKTLDTKGPGFPHIHLRCRIASIDELGIEWDHPIEPGPGGNWRNTAKPLQPVGGEWAAHGVFAKKLLEDGTAQIPKMWGYSRTGRSFVTDGVDVDATEVMVFPWQDALFVLTAYPELFEEVDQDAPKRRVAQKAEPEEVADPEPAFIKKARNSKTAQAPSGADS